MNIKEMRKLAQDNGYNIQTYFSVTGWKYRIVEYKDGWDLLPLTGYHSKKDIVDILKSTISDKFYFD